MYQFTTIYFDQPLIVNRSIDIFLPDKVEHETALLFVHGGGWFNGSKTQFHKVMAAFNRQGFICASVDYRLGGEEVKLPEQLTDLRHGYEIFVDFLQRQNLPSRIFIIGSSAGAHLGGLLALASPEICGEKSIFNREKVSGSNGQITGCALQSAPVKFEPWEDIFPPIWDCMQRIIGMPYSGNELYYRKFSLENYLNHNSCPVFHLAAANEHMFPIEYTREAARRLQACGVKSRFKIYRNCEHGFFYDVTRWQQREALQDICDFIVDIEQSRKKKRGAD